MDEKVKQFKGWFTSGLIMEDIGERLNQKGVITDYYYDYENRYEWIIADVEGEDFRLDFSREHTEHEGFENNPISFYILYKAEEPPDEVIINTARRVSEIFNCDVSLGYVDYIGNVNNDGEEFEYRKTGEILKPETD